MSSTSPLLCIEHLICAKYLTSVASGHPGSYDSLFHCLGEETEAPPEEVPPAQMETQAVSQGDKWGGGGGGSREVKGLGTRERARSTGHKQRQEMKLQAKPQSRPAGTMQPLGVPSTRPGPDT